MSRLGLAILISALLLSPARADTDIAGQLSAGRSSKVIAVVDGDTVRLAPPIDGADQVRLVGLQAPKLALGRKGFKPWPLGEESKRALEALILDRRVTLYFGGARMDRHGRHLAHLFRDDDGGNGLWIQGEMLGLGMARVYTFPDNRAVVAAMQARETAARNQRLGIWSDPFYAVRAADDVAARLRELGTFQVITGTVIDAARVKSRVYLNFGADWRSDFTVTLDARARRLFKKSGRDPLALKGRTVRVRGWLNKRTGPMIEATHPEQIELLGE